MSSNRQNHHPYHSFAAAGVAGLVETVLFHPVDTVAKRLQKKVGPIRVGNEPYLPALSRVVFQGSKEPSLLKRYVSLYSGVSWAMLYKIMQRGYKLGGQSQVHHYLKDHHDEHFENLFGSNKNYMMHLFSGSLLGAGEVVLLPLDALKIKYQTNKATYQNANILEIMRAENLYKGLSFTITRNVIGSGVFFVTPAILKKNVLGLEDNAKLTNLQNATVSFAASAASILAPSPLDVVKTRIQSEQGKMKGLATTMSMFREEGPQAFFKGSLTKIIMQGPKLAFAMFLTNKIIDMLTPEEPKIGLKK